MKLATTLLDAETAERFWRKVDQSGECWQWTAAVFVNGYGDFRKSPITRLAHRIAYLTLVGPIPDGLVLDHLCRNHRCVNPAHLEPVTNGENVRRGETIFHENALKTHCVHVHVFDDENTKVRTNGSRHCRPCENRRTREYYWRQKRARRVA